MLDETKLNIMLPFAVFNASPDNLHEIMQDAGVHTMRNYAVMHAILTFVKLEATQHAHGFDFPTGMTIPISYDAIANRAGCDRRTAIRAVKDLSSEKAGLLKKHVHSVNGAHHGANTYQILLYPEAIDKIKEDPELIKQKRKFQALAQSQDSEIEREKEALEASDSEDSDSNDSDSESHSLDLKEEGPQNAKTMPKEDGENSSNPTGEEEKALPSQNLSKRRDKPSSPDHGFSPPPGGDVVPSKQIGEMLDSLASEKRMNAAPTDESLEEFITAFNPQSRIVSTWKDVQVANILKSHLEGILSAALIEMPPLRFFKHCLQEMENRIADGRIQVRPVSLNFFVNAITGKDIVGYCADKLKSQNQAVRSKKRTEVLLQERRKWSESQAPGEIPDAAKAILDKL